MGEPIENSLAGFEGAGTSVAGTLGVGDVYADLYRRVDASARYAASHVLVLLKEGETIMVWNGVRKDCSIIELSHCCELKEDIS